jgi:outer membrane protein assembly factor BamB
MQIAPQSSCEAELNLIDSDAWQISSPNLPVRILWQKTQDRPTLEWFNGYPNSGLSMLSDQFVFYWQYWENTPSNILPTCSEYEIASLDLVTGNLKWRYPLSSLYTHPYNSIHALSDGILIILDSILIKLNPQGEYVWDNEGFPSRSIYTVYEYEDLFLPAVGKFYVVSSVTGQLLRQVEIINPISVLNGNMVSALDEHHVRVQSLNGQNDFEFYISDPAPLRSSLFVPITDAYNETLVIYDQYGETNSIEAYSINDGELVWSLEENFDSLPILSDNYLLIYDDLALKILDIESGEQVGSVNFTHNSNQLPLENYRVWMAAYRNIVVINFRDTWDFVAFEF